MSWLNRGWKYRKRVTITGETGAGTDYQVNLSIGDSAGGDFSLEGNCSSFPNDIQVTDSNGMITQDYWVEDLTVDPISMWVEVKASLESNVDVNVYYSNPRASSASDGDNTFLFFDDFSSDTLSTYSTVGTVSYDGTNDWINLGADSNAHDAFIYKGSFGAAKTMTKINLGSSYVQDYPGVWGMLFKDGSNRIACGVQRGTTITAIPRTQILIDGGADYFHGETGTPDWSTWYWSKIGRSGTDYKGKVWEVGTNEPDWQHTRTMGSDIGNAGVGAASYEKASFVDLFIVAKYILTEPAFASAGAEELVPPHHGFTNFQIPGIV